MHLCTSVLLPQAMSEEFTDVVFYKVDVDDNDVSLYIHEPDHLT